MTKKEETSAMPGPGTRVDPASGLPLSQVQKAKETQTEVKLVDRSKEGRPAALVETTKEVPVSSPKK